MVTRDAEFEAVNLQSQRVIASKENFKLSFNRKI
jgi:hypothetical protein